MNFDFKWQTPALFQKTNCPQRNKILNQGFMDPLILPNPLKGLHLNLRMVSKLMGIKMRLEDLHLLKS